MYLTVKREVVMNKLIAAVFMFIINITRIICERIFEMLLCFEMIMFSSKSVIVIIVAYFAIPFFVQHVIVFVSSSFFCSVESWTANWSSIFHIILLYIFCLCVLFSGHPHGG